MYSSWPLLAALGSLLGSLGCSWGALGVLLSALGELLDRFWCALAGGSPGVLGRSWPLLGARRPEVRHSRATGILGGGMQDDVFRAPALTLRARLTKI